MGTSAAASSYATPSLPTKEKKKRKIEHMSPIYMIVHKTSSNLSWGLKILIPVCRCAGDVTKRLESCRILSNYGSGT